jgi:carboxylate-amine ligase
MDELRFQASPALTIGIELELQLLKPHDLDLARGAGDLLARIERRKLPGAIKPEITESMIELNSAVHASGATLLAELEATRRALAAEAGLLNLRVAGGGSHPFHDWADRRIFPNERFQFVLERYGYLAKQFTVFGQHIHVGCASGDDAIYLAHMLTRHVPHFIALSASSPFYQGEDTSFQSSRLTAVSAFPLAGHIPFVADWDEFVNYFSRMRDFGIVKTMKDFYWDIRPKPEYGTVEIRVCDTPLTVRRAALLAVYAQALGAYYLQERPYSPDRGIYLVNSHNRFEACRYGYAGEMVDPLGGPRKRMGQDILDTIEIVAAHAPHAESVELLRELAAEVRGGQSDADWLRWRAKVRGSLADAVRDAASRWSD